MARKLIFGLRKHTKPLTDPESLDLWVPKGRKAWAKTYVLSPKDFAVAAAKHGYGDRNIGGFAVWGRWCWPLWQRDAMYFRCDRYALLALHEWRHIEEQADFHGAKT